MLVWALLAIGAALGGCMDVPVASDEQAAQVEEQQQRFDRTQGCRQMRRILLDENLTPAQHAQITTSMERAGCGERRPGS
jgi:hypothetical protein